MGKAIVVLHSHWSCGSARRHQAILCQLVGNQTTKASAGRVGASIPGRDDETIEAQNDRGRESDGTVKGFS